MAQSADTLGIQICVHTHTHTHTHILVRSRSMWGLWAVADLDTASHPRSGLSLMKLWHMGERATAGCQGNRYCCERASYFFRHLKYIYICHCYHGWTKNDTRKHSKGKHINLPPLFIFQRSTLFTFNLFNLSPICSSYFSLITVSMILNEYVDYFMFLIVWYIHYTARSVLLFWSLVF